MEITSTPKERFTTVLAGQYEYLFKTPEYVIAQSRYTPQSLAEKMVQGLIDGTADNSGQGIKSTCKALGIKPTYKAIKDFLA